MTSETFIGPVDTKWKKTKLVELATSLGITPVPSTIATLVPVIKDHLREHPELAENPKYQALYIYRNHNTQSRKQEKKSTDKMAEDLAESAKEPGTITGAYKFLTDGKFTTDPPAQHAHLDHVIEKSCGIEDAEQSAAGDESGTSGSEYLPSKRADEDEMDESQHGTPAPDISMASEKDDDDAQLVVVSFQLKDASGSVPAEEVLVPANGGLVSVAKVDGKETYKTSLARLIPRAIENLSPKKAADTRILRPGIVGAESTIQLGSVGSFLSGETPRSLKIPLVDQYVLRSGKEGVLVCDLFLEEGESSKVVSPKNPPTTPIKPLELAQFRKDARDAREALKSPRKKSAIIANDPDFIKFLRTLLDVQPRPARAENVGLILERYLALEGGYKKLSNMNWGRAKGGYRIPIDHETYPGQEFTKIHVQMAFEIQPTLASNDSALFEPSKLINCPDILEWIENPNGEHKTKFARMSTKNFREYITKHNEQASLRQRDGGSRSHKKDKKERKRHQREYRHGNSDDEGHTSKKRRTSLGFDSEHLDM